MGSRSGQILSRKSIQFRTVNMMGRSIIIGALSVASITGCQSGVDMERYCECSRVALEAGESISDLNTEVQNAKSRSDLRQLWKEYEEGMDKKNKSFNACLRRFQRIEGAVDRLYTVQIMYKTNGDAILFLLESAEESPMSVGGVRDFSNDLAREVEKAVKDARTDREKLCTESRG